MNIEKDIKYSKQNIKQYTDVKVYRSSIPIILIKILICTNIRNPMMMENIGKVEKWKRKERKKEHFQSPLR